MLSLKRFNIQRYQHQSHQTWQAAQVEDDVIAEEPLEVWLKVVSPQSGETLATAAQPLLTLMRTPGDDINLITGWLFTSGLIEDRKQIVTIHHTGTNRLKNGVSNQLLVSLTHVIELDTNQFKRQEFANSACGICGQQSIETILDRLERKRLIEQGALSKPISLCALVALSDELRAKQPLFALSGGNHGVALFNQQLVIQDVREDVGRHNALDKLIGANVDSLFCLGGGTPAQHHGLILSGRVGFEMIQKAAMANIRYVLALGAPSSLAIELAQETNMALIGFIKKHSFNVYCGENLLAF